MADHFTKALQPILFHRHADFLLGHVPPLYSPITNLQDNCRITHESTNRH
jgi:hypothetical protein